MSVKIGGFGLEEYPQASPRPSDCGGRLKQRAADAGATLIRGDDHILQLAHLPRGPGAEREYERAGANHSASVLGDQEQISGTRGVLRVGEHLGEGALEVFPRGKTHTMVCHDLFEQTDKSGKV